MPIFGIVMSKKFLLINLLVVLSISAAQCRAAAIAAAEVGCGDGAGASAKPAAPITRARQFADERHLMVNLAAPLVGRSSDGVRYVSSEDERRVAEIEKAHNRLLKAEEAKKQRRALGIKELVTKKLEEEAKGLVVKGGGDSASDADDYRTSKEEEFVHRITALEAGLAAFLKKAESELRALEAARKRVEGNAAVVAKIDVDIAAVHTRYEADTAAMRKEIGAVYEAGQWYFDVAAREKRAAQRAKRALCKAAEARVAAGALPTASVPIVVDARCRRTYDGTDSHSVAAAAMATDLRCCDEAERTRALVLRSPIVTRAGALPCEKVSVRSAGPRTPGGTDRCVAQSVIFKQRVIAAFIKATQRVLESNAQKDWECVALYLAILVRYYPSLCEKDWVAAWVARLEKGIPASA